MAPSEHPLAGFSVHQTSGLRSWNAIGRLGSGILIRRFRWVMAPCDSRGFLGGGRAGTSSQCMDARTTPKGVRHAAALVGSGTCHGTLGSKYISRVSQQVLLVTLSEWKSLKDLTLQLRVDLNNGRKQHHKIGPCFRYGMAMWFEQGLGLVSLGSQAPAGVWGSPGIQRASPR